jgi:hypothetical protein
MAGPVAAAVPPQNLFFKLRRTLGLYGSRVLVALAPSASSAYLLKSAIGTKPKSRGPAGGGLQLGVELKQRGCGCQGSRQSACGAAEGVVAGFGLDSYFIALDGMLRILSRKKMATV